MGNREITLTTIILWVIVSIGVIITSISFAYILFRKKKEPGNKRMGANKDSGGSIYYFGIYVLFNNCRAQVILSVPNNFFYTGLRLYLIDNFCQLEFINMIEAKRNHCFFFRFIQYAG